MTESELIAEVTCLGETEWVARVRDGVRILYIEAGFHRRETAEEVARTVAKGLALGAVWEQVDWTIAGYD